MRRRPGGGLAIGTLAALLAAFLAPALVAQAPLTGTGSIVFAQAERTMGDYLAGAMGLGFAVRRGEGSVVLRADAQYVSFGSTTVTRPYNGAGPAMDITSSAKILHVVAGPDASVMLGPFRAALAVQGGLGYAQTTGSTVLPGDPAQVNRSNSYSTFTWAVAVRASVSQAITDHLRLHWELAAVQLGETDFLREYNLPIGVISGIYLNPTPYKPLFAQASIGLSFPLQ